MELHPVIFALLTYGIAAVIAVLVAFIIKIIAFFVLRKQAPAGESPKQEGGKAP